MPLLSRDQEVYEEGRGNGDQFWIQRQKGENGAGGTETLLVRHREMNGNRGAGVVSVISTTPLCFAIPSYAGGNT